MNKYKKYLIFFLAFGAVVSCKTSSQNDDTAEHTFILKPETKAKLTFEALQLEPISEQITLTGKIEYDQNDLMSFRSLLSGIVKSVNFELGDKVTKGRVLATIQSNEIIDLNQQKNSYKNQEQFLADQLKRKQDMLKDGLASIADVNEIQNNLLLVQDEINKINATLTMYKAGAEKGTFQIISPKNGYVIQKNISIGQSIAMDDIPLFSISNLNEVWVMVNVYASNLRFIQEGSKVKVRTVAYPDKLYDGVIDKIYNVFDDNEHVLKARVKLENKDLSLLPGLSADILVDKKMYEDRKAIAIPKKAVVFEDDKRYVVIYKSDQNLEIREIKSIAENEKFVYCEEGITQGEKVVTTNALLIFEELEKSL